MTQTDFERRVTEFIGRTDAVLESTANVLRAMADDAKRHTEALAERPTFDDLHDKLALHRVDCPGAIRRGPDTVQAWVALLVGIVTLLGALGWGLAVLIDRRIDARLVPPAHAAAPENDKED